MPGLPREKARAAHRERLCVVMACENLAEASEVSQQLSQVNTGTLITYRRAGDVLLNCPSGRVALIVLATADDPQALGKTLAWMRRRWPNCPIAVVGDAGGGELELAARTGGACYLVRPVGPEQWAAMIEHVLSVRPRVAAEGRLG